MTSKFAVMFVT